MTGFIIALISGALMSVQGVFNTQAVSYTHLDVYKRQVVSRPPEYASTTFSFIIYIPPEFDVPIHMCYYTPFFIIMQYINAEIRCV